MSPARYRLVISAIGYKPQKTRIEVVANQTTTVPGIVLEVEQEQLSEVVVRANQYVEDIPSESLRQVTKLSELPQNI